MDVEVLLKEYVANYSSIKSLHTRWKEPLIAYAGAVDELFYGYKKVIGATHAAPEDLLEGAKTVITYFLPFHEDIARSNIEGRESSNVWAAAYIETNQLIFDLNEYLKNEIEKLGYKAAVNTDAQKFDRSRLLSDWSQRHAAFVAGLGKFGLNNMFITEKGCCGRIGTVITTLEIEPTRREDKEYCLYKTKKVCKKCVERCVNDALSETGFDRHKCHEMCEHNSKLHGKIGKAEVCGKCLVNVPCAFVNPSKTNSM